MGRKKAQATILGGCPCGHEGDQHGPFDDQVPRLPHARSLIEESPDGCLAWCEVEDCRGCPGMTPTALGYTQCQKPGDDDGICGNWENHEEPCDLHHTSCACCGGWDDDPSHPCRTEAHKRLGPCWYRGCDTCYGNGFTWEYVNGTDKPSVKVPCPEVHPGGHDAIQWPHHPDLNRKRPFGKQAGGDAK